MVKTYFYFYDLTNDKRTVLENLLDSEGIKWSYDTKLKNGFYAQPPMTIMNYFGFPTAPEISYDSSYDKSIIKIYVEPETFYYLKYVYEQEFRKFLKQRQKAKREKKKLDEVKKHLENMFKTTKKSHKATKSNEVKKVVIEWTVPGSIS